MDQGDGSARGVADLRAKLDSPETAEVVGRLIDRVEALESALERLTEVTTQLPNLMASVVDSVDDRAKEIQAKGVDLDERMEGAMVLAERLTDPATVKGLTMMIDLLGQAPGSMAMLMDMFDDRAAAAAEAGIDLDARIASTIQLGEKLTSPATVDGLSGVLQPGAVTIVGMLGSALVSCFEECMTLPAPREYGPLDVARALQERDVRRGVAFLINVSRFFGRHMLEKHTAMKAGSPGFRTDLDA